MDSLLHQIVNIIGTNFPCIYWIFLVKFFFVNLKAYNVLYWPFFVSNKRNV